MTAQLGRSLDMSGINMKPDVFAGIVVILCVSVPLVAFIVSNVVDPLKEWAVLLAAVAGIITFAIIYGYLGLRMEERKNKVEEVLPDFLGLASSNVRAGMTIEQALWFAARPEFGLLSREVEIMTKRTYSGEPFVQSLRRLTLRFNSRTLERTINLLVEGMGSGGEIAALLEKTSADLRQLQLLRKEISGTMLMYVIFIAFASCIGAPMLYALSAELIAVANAIWDNILKNNPNGLPTTGASFMSPQRPAVDANQFFGFALISTALTTTMSAFIVAVIQTGNMWNGLKSAPFFLIGGGIIFFIAKFALDSMFAGIMHLS